MNYFDTAPLYFEDKSEKIVGQAVLEMKKQDRPFYISTKLAGRTVSDVRRDLDAK